MHDAVKAYITHFHGLHSSIFPSGQNFSLNWSDIQSIRDKDEDILCHVDVEAFGENVADVSGWFVFYVKSNKEAAGIHHPVQYGFDDIFMLSRFARIGIVSISIEKGSSSRKV